MLKGANFRISATDAGQPAFRSFNRGMRSVRRQQQAVTATGRSWNKGLSENRRAVQQFGFQMSDFAIQIGGGQSALLAFTQQGGQMLQIFGPAGSILAALLAVFGSLTLAFLGTGKTMGELLPIMGVLKQEFKALGEVLVTIKELAIDFTNVIINHLDQILITAAVVAGYFATKWVAAWVAARVSVFLMSAAFHGFVGNMVAGRFALAATTAATGALSGALALLKRALLRLGIPALIIGLGYLIERFMAMSEVTGSWGNTLGLVTNLARAAFGEWPILLHAAVVTMSGVLWKLVAFIGEVFNVILEKVLWLVDKWIGMWRGLFGALGELINGLPAIIGAGLVAALNMIIEKFESMLNKLRSGVDVVSKAINEAFGTSIKMLGDADLGEVENTFAASAKRTGAAMVDSFVEGMNTNTLGDVIMPIAANSIDVFNEIGDNAIASGRQMANSATETKTAWEALIDVWNKARDSQIDIRDWMGGGGSSEEGSGGSSGKNSPVEAAKKEAEGIKKVFESMQKSISSSLMSGFEALRKGTKSIGEVALDTLNSIIDMTIKMLMTPIFNSIAGGLAGGIMGGVGAVGGSFLSFDGGGSTGSGTRSGGLDGKGGFLAMLHPNETVNDHTKGQGKSVSTTINMNITGVTDANSFEASKGQIHTQVARAAAAGQRGM